MISRRIITMDALLISFAIFLVAFVVVNRFLRHGPVSNSTDKGLNVANLIEKVRDELAESERRRRTENKASLFDVKTFDLELNFVVRENNTAKGGVDFEVVTIGGELQRSAEEIQKITLHMEAKPDIRDTLPVSIEIDKDHR
jgi:hypothetical protein